MAESHTPLKLRKQMLLMRAAVERVELSQHVSDLQRATTLSAIVRNAMPGDRSRSLASRAFELIKSYPFLASATSLVATRFKLPILRIATKWGGAAAVVYKLWGLWQRSQVGRATPVPLSRRLPR